MKDITYSILFLFLALHIANAQHDSTELSTVQAITSVGDAINIIHTVINGPRFKASVYNIDKIILDPNYDIFFDNPDSRPHILIQKGILYASTPFDDAGDGWIDEYKVNLNKLDESSICICPNIDDYSLNVEPDPLYIEIKTNKSIKCIQYNSAGMVSSSEDSPINHLSIVVHGGRECNNVVKAFLYLIRYYKYGNVEKRY
jgi:hypothetical protein